MCVCAPSIGLISSLGRLLQEYNVTERISTFCPSEFKRICAKASQYHSYLSMFPLQYSICSFVTSNTLSGADRYMLSYAGETILAVGAYSVSIHSICNDFLSLTHKINRPPIFRLIHTHTHTHTQQYQGTFSGQKAFCLVNCPTKLIIAANLSNAVLLDSYIMSKHFQ